MVYSTRSITSTRQSLAKSRFVHMFSLDSRCSVTCRRHIQFRRSNPFQSCSQPQLAYGRSTKTSIASCPGLLPPRWSSSPTVAVTTPTTSLSPPSTRWNVRPSVKSRRPMAAPTTEFPRSRRSVELIGYSVDVRTNTCESPVDISMRSGLLTMYTVSVQYSFYYGFSHRFSSNCVHSG